MSWYTSANRDSASPQLQLEEGEGGGGDRREPEADWNRTVDPTVQYKIKCLQGASLSVKPKTLDSLKDFQTCLLYHIPEDDFFLNTDL